MDVVDDVNYCKNMNKLYQKLAQTFSRVGVSFSFIGQACEAGAAFERNRLPFENYPASIS